MLTKELNLPPNAEPILPSQHRTALSHFVENNLECLTGVDSDVASRLFDRTNVNSLELQNRPDGDPVLVSDYLRVRNDETLTLHPVVCQAVAAEHQDQLLDDIVRTYHKRISERGGSPRRLEPVPGYPEPALDGLNGGYDLAYLNSEFEISPVEGRDCDGREIRPATDYPIEVHDILRDLRAEGIVTNLAKSGCEVCGLESGRELAVSLRVEGYEVHGYAGIAAQSHPDAPLISVQDYEWSTWGSNEVVDLVWDSAEDHEFRSNIGVEKAGVLKK